MKTNALDLRQLRAEDEQSFMHAFAEFRREDSPWDFALGFNAATGFGDYVRLLNCWERGQELPAGYVAGGFYVGVVSGEIVGRVSVRFQLNEFLSSVGGHIGYGVRPRYRREGYATEILRQSIPICAAHDIDRALITCDVDNVGSMKVIEGCGGIFEGVTCNPALDIQKRRYWLKTI